VESSTATLVEEEAFSTGNLAEEATLLLGVNKEETTALWLRAIFKG
jgi:hypothetical protein